ncbi:MAG: SH3 domain-containing protein [Eubacteriales bacterium]|nr:SH3 domain-containing protein [Eubacteriales bacterium]
MDSIREWISDNLRYIILGLALILVLVIAVLGVRAITNIANGKNGVATEKESETTANTDVIVESENQAGTNGGALTENDAQILTMMTSYYSAKTNKDIETLKKLDPSIDEVQEQANLESSYVEGYSNIRTYSHEGSAPGSYIVYVCYDGKVQNIDTLVPSLTQFYLKTAEDGSYYIADPSGDSAAEAFIEEMRKSTEVQKLIDTVAAECKAAEDSDPVLKDFMSKYGSSSSGNKDSSETKDTQSEASTEMVAIEDQINVRSEASTDGEILGVLYLGDTVTKVGESDGWTEIEFEGQKAYVKSEFLATAEEAQAQNEAEYFAPAASADDSEAAA